MRNSRLAAIIALLLLGAYVLPALCPPLPVAGMAAHQRCHAPLGCHGHHRPAPGSKPSCCHTGHEIPVAVQAAPTPTPSDVVLARISISQKVNFCDGLVSEADRVEFSPSPPAVLRI